jgi:integrase
MSRIYKRGSIHWYDGFVDGKRVRRPLSPSIKIARLKQAELDLAAVDSRYGHPGAKSKPWRFCVDKYLAASRHDMSPTTHAHNERAFKMFEEAFHPRTMADITPERLNDLKTFMEDKKVGLYARERAIRALKAGMRRMEINDVLPPQRWDIVRNVKLPRGRVVFFKHEEMVTLLKACRKPHWKSIILLGARCGLRAGEIYHLQWENVLWNKGPDGSVDICPKKDWSPKGGKSRIVPMTAEVAAHLRQEQKRAKSAYVVAEGGWRPSGIDSVGHVFSKILKAVDLQGFMHKLRHTYGSDLARAGCSAKQIAELMGHSSPRMTELYMHLSPEDVSDKARLLQPYGA